MVERIEIRKNTELLQESTESIWVRMREVLLEKGVDPKTTILAYAYPEDLHFEYGIIVTTDEQIYQYGFDYLHQDISEGIFTEWNDLTENYQNSPYRNMIEKALLILRDE